PLAKVQSMVFARNNVDESVKAFNTAKHSMNTPKTLTYRHGRIMRMPAEPDLVLFGNGHNVSQEVRNPLPHLRFTRRPGFRWRSILLSFVVDEGTVRGASTSPRRLGAHDAENRQIILDGRDTRLGSIADHLTGS